MIVGQSFRNVTATVEGVIMLSFQWKKLSGEGDYDVVGERVIKSIRCTGESRVKSSRPDPHAESVPLR